MAHKNFHTKHLRVHSARYQQCVCLHLDSHKLQLPKDIHKLQTAHSHPPTHLQERTASDVHFGQPQRH